MLDLRIIEERYGLDWLEDSRTGAFSRYATEPEESVWLCNQCELDADHCECYDEPVDDPAYM